MKEGQLFRVKVIKDESDLPKEQDRYFCHDRSYSNDFIMTLWFELTQHSRFDWLQNVDWYLIPEPEIDINQPFFGNSGARPEDRISDADIEAWAEDYAGREDSNRQKFIDGEAFDGFVAGAKSMRDGEIKKADVVCTHSISTVNMDGCFTYICEKCGAKVFNKGKEK